MSNEFTITVTSNTIQPDAQRQGSVAYTVFNASGRPITGRAVVESEPAGQAHAAWGAVEGAIERFFAIGAAEQVTLRVTLPPSAAAGSYTLRLKMVDIANVDEGVTAGPTVTVMAPPPAPPRKFPLWLIPLIVGLLALVAGVVFLLTRPSGIVVPDVAGLSEADAEATLIAAGLSVGRIRDENSDAIAQGLVARTEPEAALEIEAATPVNLFVSAGPAATPTLAPSATPTLTPIPSATPDLAATLQALASQTAVAMQATQAAQATATAQAVQATATADAIIQAAINKYTGTWSSDEFDEIQRLEISRSGTNITVAATGKFKTLPSFASQPCVTIFTSECTWGQATAPYNGDPITLDVIADTGLTHRLTLTILPNNVLSVVDQIYNGNSLLITNSYTLSPQFRLFATMIFVQPDFRVAPIIGTVVVLPTPTP